MPRLIDVTAVSPDARVYFQITLLDGISPALAETGGQPQLSADGSAWTSTGITTLTAIGDGRYYADLSPSVIATAGVTIETRYASGITAECPGDTAFTVNYDPSASPADIILGHSTAGYPANSVGWRLNLITQQTVANSSGSTGVIISGTAPYCTPQQFIDFFDVRTVGRLLSDDGVTVLTKVQVLASTILNELLMVASGAVESTCLRGERYTVADLQLLQIPPGTNSGIKLAYLVASMTIYSLYCRRPDITQQVEPAIYKRAEEMLEALGEGEAIFGLHATARAGHMTEFEMTPHEQAVKGGPSQTLKRYFGRRTDQWENLDNR